MLRRAVSLRYGAERQEETRASDWMALTMTDLLAKLQMELTGLAALTRGAAPAPRTLDRIVLARTHENIIVAERRTLRSQPSPCALHPPAGPPFCAGRASEPLVLLGSSMGCRVVLLETSYVSDGAVSAETSYASSQLSGDALFEPRNATR